MFRFQFDCKSSTINRYALIFTGVSLILAILGQINRINIIGAVYMISTKLLGKIDHLKYALSISLTGCVYDFFYVCFHSSNSSWLYIKFIEFILHFSAFLFEIMWILCVFCYLKQEETIEASNSKKSWMEKKMGNMLSTFGNLTSVKELDNPEDNNTESTETTIPTSPEDKLEQSTSSSIPLEESVDENVSNKTSLKEPISNDETTTTNNESVEKNDETLPEDKTKQILNESQSILPKESEEKITATSNNEPLENNSVLPPEEKSKTETSKDV